MCSWKTLSRTSSASLLRLYWINFYKIPHILTFSKQNTAYEIMDYFGIPGSPVLSELKNAVKEAIFDGRIPNEHDAAWAYLLEIAPSYGLALPGK